MKTSSLFLLASVWLTTVLILRANENVVEASLHGVSPSSSRSSSFHARSRARSPLLSEKRKRQSKKYPASSSSKAASRPGDDVGTGVSTSALSVRAGGFGSSENTLSNGIIGSVIMAFIEKAVKEALKAADVKFPASLGGCIFLFVFLLLLEVVNPKMANSIFTALTPGAGLLAKWLPVFFVPGLAILPLAPKIGNAAEVFKVFLVVALGWVYTCVTTTYAILYFRKAMGKLSVGKIFSGSSAQGGKPFSDATMNFFGRGTLISGVVGILATKYKCPYAKPLDTIFAGFLTVAAYVWGARLPTSFTSIVHPLVTSTVTLLLSIRALAVIYGKDFLAVLKTYRTGTLEPMKAGAGDVLLYLLGPSVVSFAISMYGRRQLLKSNILVLMLSTAISSFVSLFSTAAFVRVINLGGKSGKLIRLSVLSRNVTTALAMALTSMIGGDISLAASVVVLTAIIGGTYGKPFLNYLGVTDPVARGLGIGASSQGLGVAAIVDEPDAFPFAAVSMVLTAIAATTLATIPSVQKALIDTACGKAFF